jgi:membrane protein
MNIAYYFGLLKKAYVVWTEARAPTLGASLAYYTAFSLAPLIVLALGIAALVLGPDAARGQLAESLEMVMGKSMADATQQVVADAHQTPRSGTLAIIFGMAILLFGASGVFLELQTALNAIWMVKANPDAGWWRFVQDRFLSFTMVFGSCFLLLASLLVTTTLALARFWTLWQVVNALVGLGIVTLLFAVIFKYTPDAKIAWSDVWLGAAVTGVLFTIGRHLLSAYLGWAAISSSYGAAGSLLALLMWVYYTAQIFLYGAAFTRVHAESQGHLVRPSEIAEPVRKPAEVEQQV